MSGLVLFGQVWKLSNWLCKAVCPQAKSHVNVGHLMNVYRKGDCLREDRERGRGGGERYICMRRGRRG